jgi:hypothetical protein
LRLRVAARWAGVRVRLGLGLGVGVGTGSGLALLLRLRGGSVETGTPRRLERASGLFISRRATPLAFPVERVPFLLTTPNRRACAWLTGRFGPPFAFGRGPGVFALRLAAMSYAAAARIARLAWPASAAA